jgi:serine/threonine protein kinase
METVTTRHVLPTVGRRLGNEIPVRALPALLEEMLELSLVLPEDWEALPPTVREVVARTDGEEQLLLGLVEHGLLTEFQADRVRARTTFGLVLGNYRVLERIGAGGMRVVFKAEHVEMRRLVAIKVLPVECDQDPRLLQRFLAEARAVARLHHPNIVAAIDSGKAGAPGPDGPRLCYFVMEYVPGQDLEEYLLANGPLPPTRACDVIHQIAGALVEAHRFDLVHRDLKPSNILLTPEEQAKLLDFGLAHQGGHRLTEPGTVLGTIDYMAPEQAQDASAVDGRADIYGLGATLFWCLAGRPPFPSQGSLVKDLSQRLTQPPPSVRTLRPEVPPELDAVVTRMLGIKPEDRYPTPQALMRALLPFFKPEARDHLLLQPVRGEPALRFALPGGGEAAARTHQVLIVDDEPSIRSFCRHILEADGIECDEAPTAVQALDRVSGKPYDLVLLDINMPEMSGLDLLRHLREFPPSPHLKVVMISGRYSSDEMAQILLAGADDYLTKPFSVVQLQGRIKTVLRLKDAQDRSELLNRHLLAVNAELDQNLNARDSDLVHARNALVLALARLVA